MLTIDEYLKPSNILNAYEILCNKEGSMILGGGVFTKISSKHISTAIDLIDTGLNYIKDTENTIEIGAMTTFGDLERSDIINEFAQGLIRKSIKNIVGVQLRNLITVGGTIFGRYGFSELITSLLALDTTVLLYKGGNIKLEEYLKLKNREKDIIIKIIINKASYKADYQMFRNSFSDFPMLAVAISKKDNNYRISVGARPSVACISYEASLFLSSNNFSDETIKKTIEIATSELIFVSDRRASLEYRKELSQVLIKRAILEVSK